MSTSQPDPSQAKSGARPQGDPTPDGLGYRGPSGKVRLDLRKAVVGWEQRLEQAKASGLCLCCGRWHVGKG